MPAKPSSPARKSNASTAKPIAPAAKSKVKPIPDGYHAVTPYLIVPNVARVLEFVQKAFGATVMTPPMKGPDGKVMHAEVQIADSRVMMGESSDKHPPMPAMINLYVTDSDAVYKKALGAGAVSVMPLADQFYGDRSGGVRDPGGNMWWISTHREDVPPAEMDRRMAEQAKQKKA